MSKLFKGVALLSAIVLAASCLPACGGNSNSGGNDEENTTTPGHNYVLYGTIAADCTTAGYNVYVCTDCHQNYLEQTAEPLGHLYADSSTSARYLIACTRAGCTGGKVAESNNTYSAQLAYTFSQDDANAIAETYAELIQDIKDIGAYDGTTYDEDSDIYTSYLDFSDIYYKYDDLATVAQDQYYNAYHYYNIHQSDETALENYTYINDYYYGLYDDITAIYQLLADSKYRCFYYSGMTDEEIEEFLANYNDDSIERNNLEKANNEICVEFNSLEDAATSDEVPTLYAQFVANNKRIAELSGYDSYMDYAYAETYSRDYTPAEAHTIAEYAKTYIAPTLMSLWTNYSTYRDTTLTSSDYKILKMVVLDSVYTNVTLNNMVNGFFDEISDYGDIKFADNFEQLMYDGTLFLGEYDGAYTSVPPSINRPIIVFGENYRDSFTLIHEFGHYNNMLYNVENDFYYDDQSFDLHETHSQGLEMIYLSYLKNVLPANVQHALALYKLADFASSVVQYMAVNAFEEAVYTNTYTGTNADIIMKDGEITADEYDLLFESLYKDFGIDEIFGNATYWRYVTIIQPVYYVAYAVSILGALQLYEMAENVSLAAAVQSHSKLITYTAEHIDYQYKQVLEYAGLLSYMDEQVYIDINKLLTK